MGKWTKQIKRRDVVIEGKDTDIIIPVMGLTGVGKSTFINNFMGKDVVVVGHDLKSCTAQLKPVFWAISEPAHLQGRRLVLVDTPGFDDTYTSDSEILRRIAVTLASSHDSKMKPSGIIYLHDISRSRTSSSDCQNLDVFQDLRGSKALSFVVIGITKSGEISEELSAKRRNELSSGYWKGMIDAGATVRELGNNTSSARNLINNLLEIAQPTGAISVKEPDIESEIVDFSKLALETNAGKRLKSTLKEVPELEKKLTPEPESENQVRNKYSETAKKPPSQNYLSFDGNSSISTSSVDSELRVRPPNKITKALRATSSANINSFSSEVLILVMGQAGCGKSLFINSAANKDERRNGSLIASTIPRSTTCCHPDDCTSKFTLIEIPGFNTVDYGPPTNTDILVDVAEFLKKKFSGHIFGGILYLYQENQRQPVLTELLGNDIMKEYLLEVLTILGPFSGGSSDQGKLRFRNTPEISQGNKSAWEIIDKVYQKVGCKNLTVSDVQPGLETLGKRGLEWRKVGKSNGRNQRWFSDLFR